MVKRFPSARTAIRPGLARSIRWGKWATLPSGLGTSDTGASAAACTRWASTLPPMLSPRRRPSPVLPCAAADQCSRPVGAWGSRACLRVSSWGNPPQASTTPRLARMCCCPLAVLMAAPVTRSCSRSRRSTGLLVRMSTPASRAAASRPAVRALPLTSRMPRRCSTRSRQWASTRRVTYQNEVAERIALRKWRSSAPEAIPMPHSVVSSRGGLSRSISFPSRRPSNGAAQTERPPVPAWGVRPWKSGIPLPSMNCSAVWFWKKPTIHGACSR